MAVIRFLVMILFKHSQAFKNHIGCMKHCIWQPLWVSMKQWQYSRNWIAFFFWLDFQASSGIFFYKIQQAIWWTIVRQISPLLDIDMRYISFLQTKSSPWGQSDRSLTRCFQQHMRYTKPGAGSDTSAVQFNILIPTHKKQIHSREEMFT